MKETERWQESVFELNKAASDFGEEFKEIFWKKLKYIHADLGNSNIQIDPLDEKTIFDIMIKGKLMKDEMIYYCEIRREIMDFLKRKMRRQPPKAR